MNCQQVCKISCKKTLTEPKIFQKVLGVGSTFFWNTLYILVTPMTSFKTSLRNIGWRKHTRKTNLLWRFTRAAVPFEITILEKADSRPKHGVSWCVKMGPFALQYFRSRERKFPVGNVRSRERKHGELSLPQAFAPGNFRSKMIENFRSPVFFAPRWKGERSQLLNTWMATWLGYRSTREAAVAWLSCAAPHSLTCYHHRLLRHWQQTIKYTQYI